jgi:hypothetical protein
MYEWNYLVQEMIDWIENIYNRILRLIKWYRVNHVILFLIEFRGRAL